MATDPQHPECNEVDWQSFRYLSGEMSPVERDAFERELESSTEACESLVRMTRVALAARSVLDEQSLVVAPNREPRRQSARSGRSRVALGIAALSLLVGLMVLGRQNQEASPPGTLEQTAALVSQWSDADVSNDDEELFDRDEDSTSLNDDELPQVPGWMLAAVSLDPPATESDEPRDGNDPEPEFQDN